MNKIGLETRRSPPPQTKAARCLQQPGNPRTPHTPRRFLFSADMLSKKKPAVLGVPRSGAALWPTAPARSQIPGGASPLRGGGAKSCHVRRAGPGLQGRFPDRWCTSA